MVTTDGSTERARATKSRAAAVACAGGGAGAGAGTGAAAGGASAAGEGGAGASRPLQAGATTAATMTRTALLLVVRVDVLDAQVVEQRPEQVVFGLIEISLGLLLEKCKEVDGLFGERQVCFDGPLAVGERHLPEVDERRR